MCRSITCLAHLAPSASEEEIRAAALQFVRKLSGTRRPSRANEAAFARAVDDVAAATRQLLGALTSSGSPRTREEEARKARERGRKRAARAERDAEARTG